MASVRKLPDGRWQAQYRPVPGGKQFTRTTRRKIDAQRWLDEQTTALVSGNYVDPNAGRITFGAYFEQWAARQVWARSTDHAMHLAAGSVTFSDVPLRLLRRSHIETWIKHLQSVPHGLRIGTTGLAPSTIRQRYTSVRSVLRSAVRDRVIAADPSDGVRLPRLRKADAAMQLPAPAEVRAVIEAADREFRVFVALCAFAGLRLGEAAGLQVGDIDTASRTVDVRRQVQRAAGPDVVISLPKHGSERTVYLADGLLDLVRAHLLALPDRDRGRWLFTTEGGTPLHQNSAGHLWRKARRAAGLPTMRMHDLRHFYASGLIAAGCDVVTVQRALGHHSATITLSTYAHLWPSAEDRTRAAVSDMLADVFGPTDEPLTNGDAA